MAYSTAYYFFYIVPFCIFILFGFGIYILFRMGNTQLTTSALIFSAVERIRQMPIPKRAISIKKAL
jgi:hypothetical protein